MSHDPSLDDPLDDLYGGWYDRQGRRISVNEASRLGKNRAYKVVKQEQVGMYWISTVWLGLNHGWTETGPPVIFETMVFPQSGDENIDALVKATEDDEWGSMLERDSDRYCTEAEALAGHQRMVEKWSKPR